VIATPGALVRATITGLRDALQAIHDGKPVIADGKPVIADAESREVQRGPQVAVPGTVAT
jgi:hypothetical protein